MRYVGTTIPPPPGGGGPLGEGEWWWGRAPTRLASDNGGLHRARRLRRAMTLPEVLLWRELRGQSIRFRRQHAAGPYTLDFFCAGAKLAIEVDGA